MIYSRLLQLSLISILALVADVCLADRQLGQIIIDKVLVSGQGTDSLDVRGRYEDSLGISGIDINGHTMDLASGVWSGTIPRDSRYWINIYGTDGVVSVLEYAASEEPVKAGMQVNISDRFLEEARLPLAELITRVNLAELLHLRDERCAVDTIFLSGCDLYIEEIMALATPAIEDIHFSPSVDERIGIDVRGRIPDAVLRGRLKRSLIGYRDTSFNLKDVTFQVHFDLVPHHPGAIRLETEESEIELKIGGMRVVETNNLAAYLVPLFKDSIEYVLSHQLFLVVAGKYVEELEVPIGPGMVALDIDDDGRDEVQFEAGVDIQSLDADEYGNLVADLGLGVASLNPVSGRDVLGYRVNGSRKSELDQVSSQADMETHLSQDFVNHLLLAVYQSGAEQKLNISVKVADFGAFASQLTGMGLQLDDDVSAAIEFGGPPEVLLDDTGSVPVASPKLWLMLPQTYLRVFAPYDGEELEVVSLIGDIYLDAEISAQGDGGLSIELGNELLKVEVSKALGGILYDQLSLLPDELALEVLSGMLPPVVRELNPAMERLLNSFAQPHIDLRKILSNWFGVHFVSDVSAKGRIIEVAKDPEVSSVKLGLDLSFVD